MGVNTMGQPLTPETDSLKRIAPSSTAPKHRCWCECAFTLAYDPPHGSFSEFGSLLYFSPKGNHKPTRQRVMNLQKKSMGLAKRLTERKPMCLGLYGEFARVRPPQKVEVSLVQDRYSEPNSCVL